MIIDGIDVLVRRNEKARERLRGTTAKLDATLRAQIEMAIRDSAADGTGTPLLTPASDELYRYLIEKYDSAPSEDVLAKWLKDGLTSAEILRNVKQHMRSEGGKP